MFFRSEITVLHAKKVALEVEVRHLKEEIAKLGLKKKIEDEDIKHMVKIKEERMEVEHQKKTLEMQSEKEKEIPNRINAPDKLRVNSLTLSSPFSHSLDGSGGNSSVSFTPQYPSQYRLSETSLVF